MLSPYHLLNVNLLESCRSFVGDRFCLFILRECDNTREHIVVRSCFVGTHTVKQRKRYQSNDSRHIHAANKLGLLCEMIEQIRVPFLRRVLHKRESLVFILPSFGYRIFESRTKEACRVPGTRL